MTVLAGAALQVSSPGQPGVLSRTITNHGFLSWDQASLQLTNGATIVNETDGEFVVLSDLAITNTSGSPVTLTNHGNMTKLGGGPLALTDVAFLNTGDIHLDIGAHSRQHHVESRRHAQWRYRARCGARAWFRAGGWLHV